MITHIVTHGKKILNGATYMPTRLAINIQDMNIL